MDSPIGLSRAADLANILRARIHAGDFKVNETLPSERDLMEQFGAARATVREALRVLGTEGLTQVRRGRNGGSVVRIPGTDAVRRSLDLFIAGNDVSYADLLAVREMIEPIAAAAAAKNRTDEELQELLDLCCEGEKVLQDFDASMELNARWHLAIVRASHNRLFEAFMASITPMLHTATKMKGFDLEIRKIVLKAHWQIFWAIRDGDSEAAGRRMGRHVNAYGQVLAEIAEH